MANGDGGNGFDPVAAEFRRIDQRFDDVESHVPRIGALEHVTIILQSTLTRLEVLMREGNINTNNLRVELQFREDARRKEDEVRWTALGNAMSSLIALVQAK